MIICSPLWSWRGNGVAGEQHALPGRWLSLAKSDYVRIGDRVETGTWFMNRCDYLDPALAWVGVKDSGRGCTLSVVGYEHLTRPKSFHMRLKTP